MTVDADKAAELESRLSPWTRELLKCLSERDAQVIVLQESGLSLNEIAQFLSTSNELASIVVQKATEAMCAAAKIATVSSGRMPSGQRHRCSCSCASASCPVPATMRGALDLPVSSLSLDARTLTVLRNAKVDYVGQLIERQDFQLREIKHLGWKTLTSIRAALSAASLKTGMDVGDWTPPSA